MHVLVVGGGGREHTLAWALARSGSVTRVTSAPGNPGTARLGDAIDVDATDLDGLTKVAIGSGVDLVVVGPEAPLVAGLADRLRGAGVAVFGPDAAAARIEGSKVFAKTLLREAGIPTAAFEVFDAPDAADAYLRRVGAPIVVKADGLCAGKGALVCSTLAEAHAAVDRIMRERCFGAAGDQIVIEECMAGPELSVMALVDGEQLAVLPVAQDHKRALDGDRGPNTGGMGAYSPVPRFDAALIDEITRTCLEPTVRALARRGCPYCGVLYGGFMLTADGIRTLEYNCRFGDPEAQVVIPRLRGDFGELCAAVASGRLAEVNWAVEPHAAVCVVMASGGYPDAYETGYEIHGLAGAEQLPEVLVFQAGTRQVDGRLVTAGGRVLGVTGLGETIRQAADHAYRAVDAISWTDAHWRRDIAYQALDGSAL